MDEAAPAVGDRVPQRFDGALGNLTPEGGEQETDDDRGDGENDEDERRRRIAEADAEQGEGGECGRHQPSPPGDLHAVLSEAQQGGQQRDGCEHRDGHGGGRCDAETGDERQPDQQHAEQ